MRGPLGVNIKVFVEPAACRVPFQSYLMLFFLLFWLFKFWAMLTLVSATSFH